MGYFRKLVGTLALMAAFNAHAVFNVYFYESGSDVLVQGTGSINTTGLALAAASVSCNDFAITGNTICLGTGSALTQSVGAFAETWSITSLSFTAITSGDPVSLSNTSLNLPGGYTSGAPLSNNATFVGQTLASMGMTPGTTTLNLPNDTIVFNFGAAPPPPPPAPATVVSVPTLSEYAMLTMAALMCLVGAGFMRKRQR